MNPFCLTRAARWRGLAAALALVTLVVVTGAGARATHKLHAVTLLTVPRGEFELSLGEAPLWLPRSGIPETLTLIAGPPRGHRAADTAYVGFTAPSRACAATPAASRTPFTTFPGYFGPAHLASASSTPFAPAGGAAPGTFLATADRVTVHSPVRDAVRACVWVARDAGMPRRHHRAPRSLAASGVLALVNGLFAASASNLSGATPGHGGYAMAAFDATAGFRYASSTTQCGSVSRTGPTSVGAGAPAFETVAIAAGPCSTDASAYTFSGAHGSLAFPIADALNSPPTAVGLGGCELDPLTGATPTAATTYLAQVGCRLGSAQYAPYRRGIDRGDVAYATVDGGVAEIAPPGTSVDLVLNGR